MRVSTDASLFVYRLTPAYLANPLWNARRNDRLCVACLSLPLLCTRDRCIYEREDFSSRSTAARSAPSAPGSSKDERCATARLLDCSPPPTGHLILSDARYTHSDETTTHASGETISPSKIWCRESLVRFVSLTQVQNSEARTSDRE
ncbi:unnamed protein product [Trichogramma brassicae]|uniref:Uncharacterized protein n=1 Tax=Trichogramma brassicae TaxID=86971 RepID=A0A6H5J945_9HYME|nr:unnamed protein product [Trichogramma brassicae]